MYFLLKNNHLYRIFVKNDECFLDEKNADLATVLLKFYLDA